MSGYLRPALFLGVWLRVQTAILKIALFQNVRFSYFQVVAKGVFRVLHRFKCDVFAGWVVAKHVFFACCIVSNVMFSQVGLLQSMCFLRVASFQM